MVYDVMVMTIKLFKCVSQYNYGYKIYKIPNNNNIKYYKKKLHIYIQSNFRTILDQNQNKICIGFVLYLKL